MTLTLSDICNAIVDCEHRTAPEGDGYALLVGTKAMKSGRLVVDACKPVSEPTYKNWTRRMRPEPGDLILAREAPVGQVVRVPNGLRVCLGQRTVLIKANADYVHPRFLHYWLLGPDAQATMAAQAAGATVPHLNVEDIRNLDISRLPNDARLQAFAASVLGGLDDLIENNRRRIELLEQMAQLIYREWFVHFRYPGYEAISLTYSDLGPIPKGWRVCSIANLAAPQKYAVTSGPFGSKLGRKDYVKLGVPVIRGINLTVGGGFRDSDFVFVSASKADELQSCIAVPGDIVVTQRGTLGQVGLIPASARYERYVLSQSQMKLTVDDQQASRQYVYAVLRSEDATRRIRSMAISAGVPHINLTMLREFPLVLPTTSLQRQFDTVVGPMLELVESLQLSTETLRTTRDLLLPRLVSGEIDVSELVSDLEDSAA